MTTVPLALILGNFMGNVYAIRSTNKNIYVMKVLKGSVA